ncbi:diacylglycerol kinase [Photobacterium sp. TY1-4]|uniref:diacylglycerol kinase n=1 Tax=Photobacterium sp. TY1-4 TaxID=2899122 RepID=UPI0021BE86A0|nr:diacylglycerol kinase [Photobacterium sp. TY1-4]UXI02175.1 diacylglycerol kinase [Photobacterium sp. TY1-4]
MTEVLNKPNGKGLMRLLKAMRCSIAGFKAVYRYEAAFRQELFLAGLLLPCSLILADDWLQLILLVFGVLLILLVEIINSALEAVVDRIGLEQHELSGRAKDMGSAAVFVALLIYILIWGSVIFHNLTNIFNQLTKSILVG